MPRIGDIVEERAGLVEDMRGILDGAEAESRDLSAEERQEYDRHEERVTELTGDIRRYEQTRAAEEQDVRDLSVEQPEVPEVRELKVDSDEYRGALDAYLRRGLGGLDSEERSTLNVGTDAEGGFTVPDLWGGLIQSLQEAGTIRQFARVFTTSAGGSFHLPRKSASMTAPGIVAEEATTPDDAPTFDEVVFGDFKYAHIVKSSEEAVQDSLVDLESFIGEELGFELGLATNDHYVNGTGSGQPEGLFAGATSAGDLASNSAITVDEVIDLHYSVIRPYRARAIFISADSTIAALRKLKDSNNQYLWQPSVQADEPDRLLGKPVLSDPHVDEINSAGGQIVLGFGDVERAYGIRDVLGVTIRRLDERFADVGQVAWRGTLRTDGKIRDASAFKTLKTVQSGS